MSTFCLINEHVARHTLPGLCNALPNGNEVFGPLASLLVQEVVSGQLFMSRVTQFTQKLLLAQISSQSSCL
jgi:hypothetical protein